MYVLWRCSALHFRGRRRHWGGLNLLFSFLGLSSRGYFMRRMVRWGEGFAMNGTMSRRGSWPEMRMLLTYLGGKYWWLKNAQNVTELLNSLQSQVIFDQKVPDPRRKQCRGVEKDCSHTAGQSASKARGNTSRVLRYQPLVQDWCLPPPRIGATPLRASLFVLLT